MIFVESPMPRPDIAGLFKQYLDRELELEQERTYEKELNETLQALEDQVHACKGLVDSALVDHYHKQLLATYRQSDKIEHGEDLQIQLVYEIYECVSDFPGVKLRVVTDRGCYLLMCDPLHIGFRWCQLENEQDDGTNHPPLKLTLGLEVDPETGTILNLI